MIVALKQLIDITAEEEHDKFIGSIPFTNFVQQMFEELLTSKSDMAKYWMSYIIDVEILFQHYHCLRSGINFDEYLSSCCRMLPVMAAYGNINYLRYLSIYYWRMSTLSEDEKDKMAKIYSGSLSGKSYSKLPPDQIIEMTI